MAEYNFHKKDSLKPPPRILPILEKLKNVYLLWHEYHGILPKTHRYSLGQRIDSLFIEIIEAVRKFKTDNKIRLGEEIEKVIIKSSASELEIIKPFQDDIQGVSRTRSAVFEPAENFELDFEAIVV